MKRDITAMVEQFAAGRLSRRELVCGLTALVATAAKLGSGVATWSATSKHVPGSRTQPPGASRYRPRPFTDVLRAASGHDVDSECRSLVPPSDGVRASRPEPVQSGAGCKWITSASPFPTTTPR